MATNFFRAVPGADAVGMVRRKVDGVLKQVAPWEAVSNAMGFDVC